MEGCTSSKRDRTSNASTATRVLVAAEFLPVTSMLSVWLAGARPFVEYTTAWKSLGEYVSTRAWKAPSSRTRTMPVCGPRRPIQLTDVPMKVNVARAPTVVETAAVPPLHAALVSPCVQPAVYVPDVSSTRVPATGGGDAGPTSNASTTTALSTADGFLRPVT